MCFSKMQSPFRKFHASNMGDEFLADRQRSGSLAEAEPLKRPLQGRAL
jgi:hypothetical protein